jgi:hypothetical protein
MTTDPCPFCGAAAVGLSSNEDKDWYANTWWVECFACFARGPSQFNGTDRWEGNPATRTREQCVGAAVAAWNRRTAVADPQTTVVGQCRAWSGGVVEAVAEIPGWVFVMPRAPTPAGRPFSIAYALWLTLDEMPHA